MPPAYDTASDESWKHEIMRAGLGSWYLDSNVESKVEKELHHFQSPVYKKEGMLGIAS